MPIGWEYIRLDSIGELGGGFTPKPCDLAAIGSIPYFKVADMNNEGNNKYLINTKSYFITRPKKIFPKNSIVFPKNGGAVFTNKKRILATDSVVDLNTGVFSPNSLINIDYVYLMFSTIDFRVHYKGTALPTVNNEFMRSMLFGLPPLAEQERIVAEMEKYEPLIAEYDKLERQKTKLDSEIYDKLKKSILQYAIQGKLVPQDENDEPASELLKRIRAEKKAQLGKKYMDSYIYKGDDNCYYEHIDENANDEAVEIPFDLPENWRWTKIKSCINVVSARRIHQSDWTSEGVPFYRAREIAKLATYGTINNELFISRELYESYKQSGIPQENDLMVTAVGTIGESYIVKKGEIFYYKDASVICFENRYGLYANWLKYLMDSPYMKEQIKQYSAGTTVQTITIEKANEYLIPIPPLAEQKRIVDKINEIFAKLQT